MMRAFEFFLVPSRNHAAPREWISSSVFSRTASLCNDRFDRSTLISKVCAGAFTALKHATTSDKNSATSTISTRRSLFM
jgi:hypothetical protein